jgi:CheY-like chemotaxis protein
VPAGRTLVSIWGVLQGTWGGESLTAEPAAARAEPGTPEAWVDSPFFPFSAALRRMHMVNAAHDAAPRRTILLVDDSDDTLRPLARLLQLSGYDVRTARTAAEAMKALETPALADLIISDLGLPDAPGTDLMRDARTRHNVRGIAVTGHTGDAVVSDCKAAGFDRHFAKPVFFDELRTAIGELLDRPHSDARFASVASPAGGR